MAPAQFDASPPMWRSDADVVLIELAMGLFDGVAAAPGRSGAAADLAARYRLPVLLVLDVSGQSQTAAAVARGFMRHDPAVRIAGVVLNRVGSDRHHDGIARAMAPMGLPVLGSVPRDTSIALPERHLGLVQAGEHDGLADLLDTAGRSGGADARSRWHPGPRGALAPATGRRTHAAAAGAADRARQRCRVQLRLPASADGWRAAGAEIVPFLAARR